MSRFVFTGEDVHLGRFGNVRKGDVLDLTEREAEHVLRDNDKRFEPFVPGETKIPKPPGLKLPDNFDSLPKGEQEKVIAAAQQEEADRLAALENQNRKTAGENVDQMNKEALLAYAGELRKAGKTVEFKPDATKKQIKRAIKIALGQSEAEADGGESETETGGE